MRLCRRPSRAFETFNLRAKHIEVIPLAENEAATLMIVSFTSTSRLSSSPVERRIWAVTLRKSSRSPERRGVTRQIPSVYAALGPLTSTALKAVPDFGCAW